LLDVKEQLLRYNPENSAMDWAKMNHLVECMLQWGQEKSKQIIKSFNQETRVFAKAEVLELFEKAGITKHIIPQLKSSFKTLSDMYYPDDVDSIKLPQAVNSLVTDLLNLLTNLLDDSNAKSEDDFKIVVAKNTSHDDDSWMFKICFWCMNPAIAFKELTEQARSVVLASGTLSPLDAFASELGCNFKYVAECNHVVANDNILVAQCAISPSGHNITGTYTECEKFSYQDGIGESLLKICSSFKKGGVLCFVSSYSLLEKLLARWESTSLLDTIEKDKRIFIEPRTSNSFEEVISSYYSHIDEGHGALFMGVYRGKISEGIDFAGDYARAVVAVGLPYPNLMDVKVKFKRDYNDKQSKKGLMSGSEWYGVQAYRAYNQALGRCLRNKNDWGAIILLDSRLGKSSSLKLLPKWIRNRVNKYSTFQELQSKLNEFADRCMEPKQSDEGK
jgi:fanconi anemia group J protein